jgi:hypothetical protein
MANKTDTVVLFETGSGGKTSSSNNVIVTDTSLLAI